MPQPKSSGARSSRASGQKRSSPAPRSRSSASSGGSGTRTHTAKPAAKSSSRAKAAARPARKAKRPASPKPRSFAAQATPLDETLGASLAALRDRLSRGVVITSERLQETVEDAVRRGRMTRSDAEDLVAHLVSSGRKQTEDLVNELETLLGRSRKRVRTQARRAAGPGGDRVLREVDRARRAVGIGPSFPILGYDDLAAAQITTRLDDLNSAQLRKVREYERRHGNRKSVLDAIERNLK